MRAIVDNLLWMAIALYTLFSIAFKAIRNGILCDKMFCLLTSCTSTCFKLSLKLLNLLLHLKIVKIELTILKTLFYLNIDSSPGCNLSFLLWVLFMKTITTDEDRASDWMLMREKLSVLKFHSTWRGANKSSERIRLWLKLKQWWLLWDKLSWVRILVYLLLRLYPIWVCTLSCFHS
jgi:hypothetical protein